MRSTIRSAVFTGLALTGLAAAVANAQPASPAADAPGGTVNAVWVDHDLSFTYTGFTTHYSCNGLESKLEYVLRQLGARPGYKVTSAGCLNSGPELMPHVRIRAALPAEATPAVLAELQKTRAEREQVALASGKDGQDASAAQFPAAWRVVKFEGTSTSDVQDGDCELMEQLVDRLFKPLGIVQVEGSSLHCVPHQVTINAVNLKVRVLSAIAPAGEAPRGRR